MLFDTETSEVDRTFGFNLGAHIHYLFKKNRVTVITRAHLHNMEGSHKLEKISFKKHKSENDDNLYFVQPDLVLVEGDLSGPKLNLQQILYFPGLKENPQFEESGIVSVDKSFSVHYNNVLSRIYAAGSGVNFPSFIHKKKYRCPDLQYNSEAGFFAALSLLNKQVRFYHMPMKHLRFFGHDFYYVGERSPGYNQVAIEGSPDQMRFVAYFIYGDEVIGTLSCGFKNIHLYLLESMKQMVLP